MAATAQVSLQTHFDAVGYSPHRGQVPIHRSGARHRVAAMGRRLGKSFAGGHELSFQPLITAMTLRLAESPLDNVHRRHEIWIVGPEYTDAEKEFRVFWNDCRTLELPMDKPGSYYNAEAGDMVASFFKGKLIVHGKSAKYPGTLVGEGLTGVVMSEAAKLKPSVWTKFVRPTLIDQRGWSLWLSTPEGKNHFYEKWQWGQDPAYPEWESWRLPSWTNHYLFPLGPDDPELAEMKREMTEESVKQEIEADFTEFVGRVFKGFDEEIHVRDVQYDPQLPIYLACDYGWTNPFVMLAIQVDVWDNVRVLAEYRAVHKDINDIARELKDYAVFRNGKVLYPDPAEPQDTAILTKALKVPANTSTGGELKYRLQYIRQGLKQYPEHLEDGHPEKQPKLVIDRRCTELIREMQDYRYPENTSEVRPDKETPLDKDDHGPEALGRFYRGHYGSPTTEGKGRATVRKANMNSTVRKVRARR